MTGVDTAHAIPHPPLARSLLRLARPTQWTKSAFVLIGPFYGLVDMAHEGRSLASVAVPALAAALAFALASSACYVVNDLLDAEADRRHPRKRKRPIASGAVSPRAAVLWALALAALAALALLLIPAAPPTAPPAVGPDPAAATAHSPRAWVALALAIYVANVLLYSFAVKHLVIADVMSLSLGFVLRVMGGCAAVSISPSVWLLNVTLFLAMFLSFGKRLGERRTLAAARQAAEEDAAALHRKVQAYYTDTLLQMAVVVTGVATLMGYAAYIQDHADDYVAGFNLLWLTILPATYCLLRAIVLVERGAYDDPTELARSDRAFQLSAGLFAAITAAVFWWFRA